VGVFCRFCDVQGRECGGYILIGVVVYLGVCFIYYYNGYVFIIWLRHYAKSRKVTGSGLNEVDFFN
jgi:hypothetical protein